MPRQITDHSDCFNLNLLVLSGEQEGLTCMKQIFAGTVRKQVAAGGVVEQDIC